MCEVSKWCDVYGVHMGWGSVVDPTRDPGEVGFFMKAFMRKVSGKVPGLSL
jgi:hypothetical protein